MIKQYGWKRQSRELKGEERLAHRKKHERIGEIVVWSAIVVASMGFVGRMIAGWVTSRDITSELMPESLHGWTGPLGVILLWIMARWGRSARDLRLNHFTDGNSRILRIPLYLLGPLMSEITILETTNSPCPSNALWQAQSVL
jgi:hypothetical protein